ncbi:SHOCT domain-containing protein [Arthrobacter sp. MPF02]|uniref:SHOCT domain-containing protein n=1 Tax=Arthrobacter sp. MPF02 TaxID=3388492 RepID=UPI0039850E04
MKDIQQQGGSASAPCHAVYPCSAHTRWIVYTTHLVVESSEPGIQPLEIGLGDLRRIDYKESGFTSAGFAEIVPAGGAPGTSTSDLTFPLSADSKLKQQREVFLQTLAAAAPHVVIQPMERSRVRDLSRHLTAVRHRAAMVAATNKKAELMDQQRDAAEAAEKSAERRAQQKAIREVTAAADLQRSLMRPDGTRAPEPAAIVGSVHAAHFRLYPDAIVLVTSAQAGAMRQEIHFDPHPLSSLQWSKSEEGRGYLRFHEAGSDIDRNDPDDPNAVRCSPEKLQWSLNKIQELYPSISIRQSQHFGDIKSVLASAGWSKQEKVLAALNAIAGFSQAKHLIGSNGHVIALDSARNRLCVLDLNRADYRVYQAADLQSVEVFEYSKTLTRHRKDGRGGRALATAGFLVGDAGSMLVGMTAAKAAKSKDQVHEITLRIELSDPKRPIYDVQLFRSANSPLKMGSALHASISSQARTWSSLLTALIRYAESQAVASVAPQAAPSATPPPSVVDELSRLAALHSSGHLTDAEFATMKARLIH